MPSTGKTVAVYLGIALLFAFAVLSGVHQPWHQKCGDFKTAYFQAILSSVGCVGLMVTQNVPTHLITGNLSSFVIIIIIIIIIIFIIINIIIIITIICITFFDIISAGS